MMMQPQDPFFSRLQPQRQRGGMHHRALMTQLGGGGLGDATAPGLTPQITPDPMGGRMPWHLAPLDQMPGPATRPIYPPSPDPQQGWTTGPVGQPPIDPMGGTRIPGGVPWTPAPPDQRPTGIDQPSPDPLDRRIPGGAPWTPPSGDRGSGGGAMTGWANPHAKLGEAGYTPGFSGNDPNQPPDPNLTDPRVAWR